MCSITEDFDGTFGRFEFSRVVLTYAKIARRLPSEVV